MSQMLVIGIQDLYMSKYKYTIIITITIKKIGWKFGWKIGWKIGTKD